MSVLYLTEADVDRLLDVPTAVDVVETAFRQLATGGAVNVPRVRAQSRGIVLHTLIAAADYLGLVGWKCYTTTRGGARFLVGLYEQASGALVALIEGDRLGQLRTGAATGVAVRHLAVGDARRAGIFGAGRQARTQLAAVAAVRPLESAVVFSRSREKCETFAAEMSAALAIRVTVAGEPTAAVRGMPLVVTATTSAEPVFEGVEVDEGAMVCAVGSNWLNRAEIDETVVRRATRIVCDSVEACRGEAGDFSAALAAGVFTWSQAVDLGGVLTGRVIVDRGARGITLFKSVGLGIEDLALGACLLERARQAGVGTALPM